MRTIRLIIISNSWNICYSESLHSFLFALFYFYSHNQNVLKNKFQWKAETWIITTNIKKVVDSNVLEIVFLPFSFFSTEILFFYGRQILQFELQCVMKRKYFYFPQEFSLLYVILFSTSFLGATEVNVNRRYVRTEWVEMKRICWLVSVWCLSL